MQPFPADGNKTQITAVAGQGSSDVSTLSQIHVVLNWFEELKGRVGGR